MLVGKVIDAREEDVEQAFENALRHKDNWANTPGRTKSGHFRKNGRFNGTTHAAVI